MTDRPTPPEQTSTDEATDARVDAIARSAGRELRRPAPANGLARIERAKRNRQLTRAAGGGLVAVALVVAGVAAIDRRDSSEIVTSDSTIDTTEPQTTTPPETVPPSPETSVVATVPSTDPVAPPSGAVPPVVYAGNGAPDDPDMVQSLIDPETGVVIGTEPADAEEARQALEQLIGVGRSSVDLGDVAYDFTPAGYDSGTLAVEVFPDIDLCEQNVVGVQSSAGSAVPDRARFLVVTRDDRSVVTLSADCPEAGTMGRDATVTSLPYDRLLQVFDARQPELPGRTLAVVPSTVAVGGLTSSGNGRFVALETYGEQFEYRIFDLVTGTEIDLGTECPYTGSNVSRFMGPWVGEASIALSLQCADGAQMLIRDLTPNGRERRVDVPNSAGHGFATIAVDHATFSSPDDAWFTLCDLVQTTCWVGHGSEPLVELAGMNEASFLPIGFSPGG